LYHVEPTITGDASVYDVVELQEHSKCTSTVGLATTVSSTIELACICDGALDVIIVYWTSLKAADIIIGTVA
jgi:hypothetical protein